jgi:hypothetical protein
MCYVLLVKSVDWLLFGRHKSLLVDIESVNTSKALRIVKIDLIWLRER